jgi:hypothetical protein
MSMRAVFGVAGLVVALAVVGLLGKKQLSAVSTPVPALQTAPAVDAAATPAPAVTVREQSQQLQQQYRQQVEGLLQQARPMPDTDN